MSYTFDPMIREQVAAFLYENLPGFYRTADEPPNGQDELRRFLQILAIPLAAARQNIEEFYADLFIDTAHDRILPYLAEMVGTRLIFPDPASNRRDIRGTIGWRRQKGTPAMLQAMASELSGQLAVTMEGWKYVQLAQDLNVLRKERATPDLRPPIVAEQGDGPLVALPHAVDLRAITQSTGKYHPRHIAHWLHPTEMFEVLRGQPADLRRPAGDPDFRFAIHPLGDYLPLRARRVSPTDTLRTDRVPALHFAAAPENWFGQRGLFDVEIHGVSAAIAKATTEQRAPLLRAASHEAMDGNVRIEVLDFDPTRIHGQVRIEIVAAPLAGALPSPADVNPGLIQVRAHVVLDVGGAGPSVVDNGGAVDDQAVLLIRLLPEGSAARHFPGATIEILGEGPAAWLAAEEGKAAREGFRRGSLFLRIPASFIDSERWFYVGADGSIFEAQSIGSGPVDVNILAGSAGARLFDLNRVLQPGPGPAWPPLTSTSDPEPFEGLPLAPGHGPAVLHGGRVVVPGVGGWSDIAAGDACVLVFAATWVDTQRCYSPFARIFWNGPSPLGANWEALGINGLPIADADARFRVIRELAEERLNQFRLVARFESVRSDAVFTAAEIALTSYEGRSILFHTPDLTCLGANPVPAWPPGNGMNGISRGVTAGADGSAWEDASTINFRLANGAVAPISEQRAWRRRRVHARVLCPWRNENPPGQMHAATGPGRLDIDATNGLFSFADSEPPTAVTVTWQEGFTAHLGARAASREPALDRRLDTPTRLVSASGALHSGAPLALHNLPRHTTLAAALAAIQANPTSKEVIQFEDSFTYTGDNLVWPAGCQHLTIQAAERERPVLIINSTTEAAGASFEDVTVIGISFGAAAAGDIALPASGRTQLAFCSVHEVGTRLVFQLTPNTEGERVELIRSVLARLRLAGEGQIVADTCIIDSGMGAGVPSIEAETAHIKIVRSTVVGSVRCFTIDASECIFNDLVNVTDRFHGCVRYSRVTADSVLPRQFRTTTIEPLFVSVNRRNPAHMRLAEACDRAVVIGAEDGSEMGAFHDRYAAQRREALWRRLREATPAGLETGMIRLD